MMKTVLTNCTVIDCTGSPPMSDTTIAIEDSKIVALKRGMYRRADEEDKVRVFDLGGGYVLPGLWNAHTHLGDVFPDPKHMLSSESVIDEAIRAGRNLVDALRAGVTGIRAVGEDAFIDMEITLLGNFLGIAARSLSLDTPTIQDMDVRAWNVGKMCSEVCVGTHGLLKRYVSVVLPAMGSSLTAATMPMGFRSRSPLFGSEHCVLEYAR